MYLERTLLVQQTFLKQTPAKSGGDYVISSIWQVGKCVVRPGNLYSLFLTQKIVVLTPFLQTVAIPVWSTVGYTTWSAHFRRPLSLFSILFWARAGGSSNEFFSFFLPSSTLECHGPAVNDIHRKYYVKKKRQSWDSKPSQSQIQKNIAPNSFTIFSVLFDRHKKRINHSMAHTGYLFYDIDSHPDVGNFAGWAPNRNWVTMRVRLSQHRINKTPRTASRARDILYLWMTHSIESLLFVIFLRWCQYKWRANESCV
jgi:hypothetical protein